MNADSVKCEQWDVGAIRVTAVVESETGGIPPQMFFPDATAERVRAQPWAAGTYSDATGHIAMRVQAFVIDDGKRRVLVDPCVGNGKDRALPFWHQQEYPFLDRMIAAGYPPNSIDLVVHTHLHADHVGWDTSLRDGHWVPTFANARHLYVREELEFWQAPEQRTAEDVFADSIEPIFRAGLAETIADTEDLGGGLCLVPSHGHTPGHASLWIASEDSEAVITGDFIHHSVQCSEPEWAEVGDLDIELATTTRRQVLARYATDERLVLGSHFPTCPAGQIRPSGDVWRFAPVPGAVRA